jgi:uncharacterized protein YciI
MTSGKYYVLLSQTSLSSVEEARFKDPQSLMAHMARSKDLHAQGKVMMAGAFVDNLEEKLSTMAVFSSGHDAEDYAQGDPFVLNGTVTKWYIRELEKCARNAGTDGTFPGFYRIACRDNGLGDTWGQTERSPVFTGSHAEITAAGGFLVLRSSSTPFPNRGEKRGTSRLSPCFPPCFPVCPHVSPMFSHVSPMFPLEPTDAMRIRTAKLPLD